MLETKPWDAAEFLTGWEGVREYLVATLEDGEPWEVAKALHTITRAPGLAAFAEHVGLSETELKAAFSDPHRQDLARMSEVLNAIGWRLAPTPVKQAEAA